MHPPSSNDSLDIKPWILRDADAERVDLLSKALELPPAMARVLVARGVDEVARAEAFLEPRLADLTDPKAMAGIDLALDRLLEALLRGEKIAVFGDYDVDGVSSAAMVGDYLRRAGADLFLRVARRDEGYGFHVTQAQELMDGGAKLLVLTDTGSHDLEAVAHAQGAGVDVIALDHHRVETADWPGLVLVNPQRPDCSFAYKGLCAAGVAFYVLAAFRRRLEAQGREAPDPRELLDLVALATLADVVPLTGDNRVLVAHGLRALARTPRPGLAELLRLSDLRGRRPTASDVAWRLGPRLNAPGRLGDAGIALDCLALREEEPAVARARRCDALNSERKAIQEEILVAAREQVASQAEAGFILVAGEGWHPGVIGIVAGRLSDEFDRPAAVVALEDGRGRGSARSVEGVDVLAILSEANDLLVRFGGHAGAAGFSVEEDQLDLLRGRLQQAALPLLRSRSSRVIAIDAELTLDAIDRALAARLAALEPHGKANPTPLYVARGARVERAEIVGQKHLRLVLRQGKISQRGIAFGLAASRPEEGSLVDIVFAVEIDHYQGLDRLQLRIVAIAPSEGT